MRTRRTYSLLVFRLPSLSIFHGSIECCPTSGRHKFIGSGNLEFELPDPFKESRQNLTLGVRPEHFKLTFDSPKQDFLIQRIEYLGDCQVLHLQFEEHEITAKTNGVTPVSDQNAGLKSTGEKSSGSTQQARAEFNCRKVELAVRIFPKKMPKRVRRGIRESVAAAIPIASLSMTGIT